MKYAVKPKQGGGEPPATSRLARLGKALVVFGLYLVLEIVAKAMIVLQFVMLAIRHRPNARLAMGGAMLADFMHDMWAYCTFASDFAPWPFAAWPRVAAKGGPPAPSPESEA